MKKIYDNCSNFRCVKTCDDVENKSKTPFPEHFSDAMAYIPFQTNSQIYDEIKAFERGTLFPVLDKPFMGGSQR